MKEPISIKEILAIVIRRGTAVLLTALVLAAALGGFQGAQTLKKVKAPTNTAEQVAQRNEAARTESDAQEEMIRGNIATAEHRVAMAREYLAESPLMRLDPYDKYESHVVLSIGELDESEYVRAYQDTLGTPVDYVVAKILQQYELYWNKVDLSDALAGTSYEAMAEKYIRELVTVERSQGSTLVITASADSAENAEILCQRTAQTILDAQETMIKATFTHTLVPISDGTKQMVDYDLDRSQIIAMEKYDEYMLELEEYKADLKKIKRPAAETLVTMADAVKDAAVWAVLGGLVGFVLACGTVWLVYIVRDDVETSRQAEAILDAPFLGCAAGRKGFFDRVADRFVGERSWREPEMAARYIAENLISLLPEKASVALLSTAEVQEDAVLLPKVLEALKARGCSVRFAAQAERNPAAVAALRECDYVLMAERLGESNRNAMLCVKNQAAQLDAKLVGFITL